MPARVLSLNIGLPERNPAKRAVGRTGIRKQPVESAWFRAPGPKGGLGSGVEGDFIGDAKHHGGDRQAVYAVAREELDSWGEQLGRQLPDGMFGENLTIQGLDVDGQRIGARWAVGDEVVLIVTGPRVPCATFGWWLGEPHWVKRFTEVGRTGAYLAVERGGAVRRGDKVAVLSEPEHDIVLPLAFRAFMGDHDAADQVLSAGVLPAEEQQWLEGRIR